MAPDVHPRFCHFDPLEDVEFSAGAAQCHDVPLDIQPRHIHAVRMKDSWIRRLLDVPDAIVARFDQHQRRI